MAVLDVDLDRAAADGPEPILVHAVLLGPRGRQHPVPAGHVVVHGHAQLPEVVLALAAAGRLAGGLDRRQEQRHQNADDGDHDQQFDQRKRACAHAGPATERDTGSSRCLPPGAARRDALRSARAGRQRCSARGDLPLARGCCNLWPLSLAACHQSRVGRSSDFRAWACPAFSSHPPAGESRQWPIRLGNPPHTRSQRRGHPGIAPEFPVRRPLQMLRPTTNAQCNPHTVPEWQTSCKLGGVPLAAMGRRLPAGGLASALERILMALAATHGGSVRGS